MLHPIIHGGSILPSGVEASHCPGVFCFPWISPWIVWLDEPEINIPGQATMIRHGEPAVKRWPVRPRAVFADQPCMEPLDFSASGPIRRPPRTGVEQTSAAPCIGIFVRLEM